MSSSAGGHSRPISIVDALLNPESSSLTSRKVVSDSRFHGYNGPTRSVTLHNISSPGSGAISASQDGERCVVAGRDCEVSKLWPVQLELLTVIMHIQH